MDFAGEERILDAGNNVFGCWVGAQGDMCKSILRSLTRSFGRSGYFCLKFHC